MSNKQPKNYHNEESSESEDEEYNNDELHCKNMDPALAKLMGIIMEEQNGLDWKPPSKSGLDNSDKIISSTYFTKKDLLHNVDYLNVIKDDILSYKTLSERQLEYIKNLNNEDKFEVIQTYNKVLDITTKNLS